MTLQELHNFRDAMQDGVHFTFVNAKGIEKRGFLPRNSDGYLIIHEPTKDVIVDTEKWRVFDSFDYNVVI